MILSLLLALALQSGPSAAEKAAEPPPPAGDGLGEIPHGAPTDDYGFTAWCRGALTGHMELYPAVKSELRKVEEEKAAKEDARYTTDAQREAAVKRRVKEALDDTKLDEAQLAAGRTYLKLYSDAIAAAEAASASNLRKRGQEAQDSGFLIWSAARGAEPRTKMWSWVMWELPARCETAARRLLDRSSLLAGALKPQPVAERRAEATLPAGDAKPAPAEADRSAESADAKPPEAAPISADKAPSEATAPAATGSSETAVIRRRSASPPSDAPDAPRPDPKS